MSVRIVRAGPVDGMTDLNERKSGKTDAAADFVSRSSLGRPALYSRFVSAMKVMLPVVAGVVLVVVVVYSGMFDRESSKARKTTDASPASRDVQMENPKINGTDAAGRPYVITALKALQSGDRPGVMILDRLQADLRLDENGNWVSASSPAGVLDTNTHTLDVSRRFDVYTSWGYEFHGASAAIDFKQGTLKSNEPVQGHGPAGSLSANAMVADQKSNMIHFTGDVEVTIFAKPQAKKEK